MILPLLMYVMIKIEEASLNDHSMVLLEDTVNTTNCSNETGDCVTKKTTGVNYLFEMLVKQEIEKNVGWELLVAIISNSVSLCFIILGAAITFWLKNFILTICCLSKKEEKELNDQIDVMMPMVNGVGRMLNNLDNATPDENEKDEPDNEKQPDEQPIEVDPEIIP